MNEKSKFSSEAMLCKTFIRHLPAGWTAYAECQGWDIILVRDDGLQIGVEAKLTLNAKVICQAAEDGRRGIYAMQEGPDFRAVLIPYGTAGSMGWLCHYLGLTVIQMMDKATFEDPYNRYEANKHGFKPALPEADDSEWFSEQHWYDMAPARRITLPEYVPDVAAGRSGPTKLTDWKIKAIKIAVTVERRGFVTRADFKHVGIDHRRWLNRDYGWLVVGEKRGTYIAGPRLGDFKAQHPKNFEQIAADYDKWRTPDDLAA